MEDNIMTNASFYDATVISDMLMDYTIKHSRFKYKRNYLSISQCHLDPKIIIANMEHGFKCDTKGLLKCYKGYQMEKDLKNRIKNVFGGVVEDFPEIQAFNGRVKGHPDFAFMGYPGDCKSVLKDEWIPDKQVSRKIYYQMQGYMFYANTEKSVVIFESRESGIIKAFWIQSNRQFQKEIDDKFNIIIQCLDDDIFLKKVS